MEEFFLAAELAPEFTFAVVDEGWDSKFLFLPNNVRWLGQVAACDRNRLSCSARMVLNLIPLSVGNAAFSPPASLFDAAGAGACVITNPWEGVETFFEPGCDILVARDASEIVDLLRTVDTALAREVGGAMRRWPYWSTRTPCRCAKPCDSPLQQCSRGATGG